MQHGREDMEERLLAEAKIEAERLIIALESGIREDADLLAAQELAAINAQKLQLQDSLKGQDRAEITANTAALENKSPNSNKMHSTNSTQ